MQSESPFPKDEIRKVLLLATDAALAQERAEHGMLGGLLPDHLQTLMTGFRSIDDWQDAVHLQKRITKIHRVDVLFAPPNATLADYRKLQKSAKQLGNYDCDNGLQRIVSQELADGFSDDAEQVAKSISDARIRSDTFTDIAVFLWEHGKRDAAGRLFQAAVDSALTIQPSFGISDSTQPVAQQLANIAQRRYKLGDESGGKAILSRFDAMVAKTEGHLRESLCETAALTHAELGLFDEARASADCITREDEKQWVEGKIRYEQLVQSEPSKILSGTLAVATNEDRVDILSKAGQQQAEAGNKAYALAILDQAIRAFDELSKRDLYPTWAAYRLRLIAVGYLDAGDRTKGEDILQRLSSLKEATASPRDQYDFLYDLAVGYAFFGLFDEAHRYVDEMGDYPNEQACNVVAYAESHQGQSNEAVRWASQLKDPAARTSALVGIVEALQETTQETDRANR